MLLVKFVEVLASSTQLFNQHWLQLEEFYSIAIKTDGPKNAKYGVCPHHLPSKLCV